MSYDNGEYYFYTCNGMKVDARMAWLLIELLFTLTIMILINFFENASGYTSSSLEITIMSI